MATSSIFTDPVYKGEEEITAFLDALEASKARAHTIPKPDVAITRLHGKELLDYMQRTIEAIEGKNNA